MAQVNGSGNNSMLIRPEQLNGLPMIDESKKTVYKTGLARLWQQYDQLPAGSAAQQEMENKIRSASVKIMGEMVVKLGRPGSGAGSAQAQQQQRPPSMSGQPKPQAQPSQQPQPAQQDGSTQPQTGQQQGQQPNLMQIPPNIRQQLDSITIHVPPNVRPEQHASYKSKWYQQAAQSLMKKEHLMNIGRQASQRITAAQQSGAEVPGPVRDQFDSAKRGMKEIEVRWNNMRNQNEQNGKMKAAAMQGQNAPQGGQSSQAPPGATAKSSQDVKGANQRPVGAANQGSPMQQTSPVTVSAQNGQNGAQQGGTIASQQTPQSATQTQPFSQTQGANASGQQRTSQSGSAMSQGPVGQQTPANAQWDHQPPRSLSQQAAVAQAQEQYAKGQAQQGQTNSNAAQQAVTPQVPNAMAFPQQQQSGISNTPSSAYPPPNSMQGPTNKFPITKQLNLDPRGQQPVAGPPSRPTLANLGMTTQPGLTRPQPFTLEGEGDRVLSKRKLDELVRQVTGSSDTSPESGGLTPDVEEALLSLADDFVDNVITSACRLAKLRTGQTLDIKDIQMVLERNYGIRIPGYSLDEVRTVRKFQPAVGWQSKMQAIQTAKTLGGVVNKGDA